MVKEEWETHETSRDSEKENYYITLVDVVNDVVNRNTFVSKAMKMLIDCNYYSIYDIVHELYIRLNTLLPYYFRRYIEVEATLEIREMVTEYKKYHTPVYIPKPDILDGVPDIDDRVFQYKELSDVLEGKISESTVWRVISNYRFFKQIDMGIRNNVSNISKDDIHTICIVSDYLLKKEYERNQTCGV